MKNSILSHLMTGLLVLLPIAALCGSTVKVDVLYMNHGPLQATIDEIKSLAAKYGPRVTVAWHDVDTQEGEKFMAEKKLTGHIPLVIWVNDSFKLRVDGKDVSFTGFPTGSGPAFFQGKWTMADLQKALDQSAAKK
jgi:hypothetical protein